MWLPNNSVLGKEFGRILAIAVSLWFPVKTCPDLKDSAKIFAAAYNLKFPKDCAVDTAEGLILAIAESLCCPNASWLVRDDCKILAEAYKFWLPITNVSWRPEGLILALASSLCNPIVSWFTIPDESIL